MMTMPGKLQSLPGLLLLAVLHSHAADQDRLSLTTGIDYSSGKYGGSTATSMRYVPLILRHDSGPWTLKLTLPYLEITGPGNVIGGTDPIVVNPGAAAMTRRTASGMGDVVASAGHSLVSGESGWYVDLTGKVKFGTADAAKGLGTGKNDYALGTDVFRTAGRMTGIASIGYKVTGSTDTLPLRNVWFGSLGATGKTAAGNTLGLNYDFRQSASRGTAAPRDITGFISMPLDRRLKLQFYLSRGLSDGSADFGAGAMVGYTH
jgi:hypothetical protein